VQQLIEQAIYDTAKRTGYKTKELRHSADVKLASRTGVEDAARELVSMARELTAAFKDMASLNPRKGQIVLSGVFQVPRGFEFDEQDLESEELDEVIEDLKDRAKRIPALRGFRPKEESWTRIGRDYRGVLVLKGKPFDADEMAKDLSNSGFVVTK
jgi:hypothetical protein